MVEADKQNPSYFVSFIDESDLREGIVLRRLVVFWERFIISKVIAAGKSLQYLPVKCIDEGMLKHLDSLSPEYCLKGILWFWEQILFLH